MYVVVELGGQQYIVKNNDTIVVDRVEQAEWETFVANTIVCAFDGEKQVMVGAPYVTAGITFKVKEHVQGDKVHTVKFQWKKRYHRNKGFRAAQSVLVVEEISLNGK